MIPPQQNKITLCIFHGVYCTYEVLFVSKKHTFYVLPCPLSHCACLSRHDHHGRLNRYIKLRIAHAPGMSGTFSPPPRVSDPGMHHGTCVTHVPWCMPGSLTSGFLWSRWWGKSSRHSRRMRNPQFYVSGKRPMRTCPIVPSVYGVVAYIIAVSLALRPVWQLTKPWPEAITALSNVTVTWFSQVNCHAVLKINKLWVSSVILSKIFSIKYLVFRVVVLNLYEETLQWRHNGRDSVSNHQPHDCLLNGLFRRRSKKTRKLRVTCLCVGNSPGTGEFPAHKASDAENVFIWWRHHVYIHLHFLHFSTHGAGNWNPSIMVDNN